MKRIHYTSIGLFVQVKEAKREIDMLHLIIGSMFSGKTCEIIRLANVYRAIGKKVLFINHVCDVRYAAQEDIHAGKHHVISHSGCKELCLGSKSLGEVLTSDQYRNSDIVIIEEAHFFPDLFDVISKESDKMAKQFIVSGLSGDSNREPIGDILRLIPYADDIQHLKGFCGICKNGTSGSFTKRNSSKTDKFFVGGNEAYMCVCRDHYVNV